MSWIVVPERDTCPLVHFVARGPCRPRNSIQTILGLLCFLFSLLTWVCSTFVALVVPTVTLSLLVLQLYELPCLKGVSHILTYIYRRCCLSKM